MSDYHARFLSLVDEVERTYAVTRWRVGEIPAWPLARASLHGILFLQALVHDKAQAQFPPQPLHARIYRTAAYASTPLANIWRSRKNLEQLVCVPKRADVLFLGDGESLDQIGGAWRDRYCDPLIDYLQSQGRSSLLMQRGALKAPPWSRPTFPANTIVNWGALFAAAARLSSRLTSSFPDYERVLLFLDRNGVPTHELAMGVLRKRAALIAATAIGFEQVLKVVQPSICFIVAYYRGMGHALTLACRRQGVLSVELQREGRGARHEAYCWSAVPEAGYSILPAIFWTWTEEDNATIDAWTRTLTSPWHRGLHGGHPQLAAWFKDDHPDTRAFDARINAICARTDCDIDILVGLQVLVGYEGVCDRLARLIERSPSRYRWWLRCHPNSGRSGLGADRMLAIRRPNVLIDEACNLPLPALLRHMDAFLSVRSGASIEASIFGLKPIFLSQDARGPFPHLVDAGKAEIIDDIATLEERLKEIRPAPRSYLYQPELSDAFSRLGAMAEQYRRLVDREKQERSG